MQLEEPLAFLVRTGLLFALPPAYYEARRRLRQAALITDFYSRPKRKVSQLEGAHGSKLVRHPDARLIPESTSMPRHVEAAEALGGGVQPEFDETPPPDLAAAVRHCCELLSDMPGWRENRADLMRSVEQSLRPFASIVASFMKGSPRALASHVNLPFMAACVSALQWPDVHCVRRWFYGHNVVGDIPDTGLFRPHFTDYEPNVAPAATLAPASNRVWNHALERTIAAAGLAAANKADALAILRGVERATQKELDAGVIQGPYTRKDLNRRFGKDLYRTQRRFGVAQGVDDNGSPKIRAIDNSASNQMNACTRTHETIAPPSFAFTALVARSFCSALADASSPMLPLAFGLDDMARAYRRIPVRDTHYTVFAHWSVDHQRVLYYCMDGHNFGFRSAVLNFNAFPHLVCAIARSFFAVPCDHFFDDFMIVDLQCAGPSGQLALTCSLGLLG